jgi:hypothetical protein
MSPLTSDTSLSAFLVMKHFAPLMPPAAVLPVDGGYTAF